MGGSFAKPIEITSVHYVGFLQKMSRMDGKVALPSSSQLGRWDSALNELWLWGHLV